MVAVPPWQFFRNASPMRDIAVVDPTKPAWASSARGCDGAWA